MFEQPVEQPAASCKQGVTYRRGNNREVLQDTETNGDKERIGRCRYTCDFIARFCLAALSPDKIAVAQLRVATATDRTNKHGFSITLPLLL